jgi:hypothetical protein
MRRMKMVTHLWGDPDVDWSGISEAAYYIAHNLKRRGRITVRDYKEKFGTVRVYCDLGWYSLLSITHPGYVHYRPYPRWLVHLDIFYLSKLVRLFNVVVVPWHKKLYRQIYAEAVEIWPHLAEEITCAADYPELLKGL